MVANFQRPWIPEGRNFRTLHTLTCQIIVQQILLIFWEKNTYTTLLRPTCLLISEIFPSKPDFHLYKWEKIQPTRLLISEKSATYTIKWSYRIIWQVRVPSVKMMGVNRKINFGHMVICVSIFQITTGLCIPSVKMMSVNHKINFGHMVICVSIFFHWTLHT
jgi:hypothetical protein